MVFFLKHFSSYTVCEKSGRLTGITVSPSGQSRCGLSTFICERFDRGCKQFPCVCAEGGIFCVTNILMSQVVNICLSLCLQTPLMQSEAVKYITAHHRMKTEGW